MPKKIDKSIVTMKEYETSYRKAFDLHEKYLMQMPSPDWDEFAKESERFYRPFEASLYKCVADELTKVWKYDMEQIPLE